MTTGWRNRTEAIEQEQHHYPSLNFNLKFLIQYLISFLINKP